MLLSNTSKQSDLVYIFSQPILHEYLFEKFNIYRENGDAIEYYIQLLKTIILKISTTDNQTLLKLFCNNRFPSFPLLAVVTILGTNLSKEVLVKITAHQCVLLLISLMIKNKTGLSYLVDLQMIVFYFELTRELIE